MCVEGEIQGTFPFLLFLLLSFSPFCLFLPWGCVEGSFSLATGRMLSGWSSSRTEEQEQLPVAEGSTRDCTNASSSTVDGRRAGCNTRSRKPAVFPPTTDSSPLELRHANGVPGMVKHQSSFCQRMPL